MGCRMIKKGVLGVGLGAVALGLMFGHRAPSYVRTAFHKARHEIREAAPIGFDIDRARDAVAALRPAMEDNLENIVRSEVEIEYLDREVLATRANLAAEKKEMLALRDELKNGEYKVGSTSYTPEEVRAELARRFDRYTQGKVTLETKESILKARRQAVVSARDQLRKMADQKQTLLAKIEALEARWKQIQAADSAENVFSFDDSPLSRARADVADLEKRVEVMSRVAAETGKIADKAVPVMVAPGRDVVKQIDAEFGAPAQDPKTADKDL